MSLSQIEEVKCPCGEVFVAELWSVINVIEDPSLKDSLLGGEINVVKCPKCGIMFYAEHFLLYHDSVNELLAFVYPESFAVSKEHWQMKMIEQFENAQSDFGPEERLKYEPLLIFGLEELLALIRKEEELEDEIRIVEYECRKMNIQTLKLKPSVARKKQIPALIPSTEKLYGKDELIVALKAILKENPRLEHYGRFLEKIFSCPPSDFEEILP